MTERSKWAVIAIILICFLLFLMFSVSSFLNIMRPEGLSLSGSGDKIAIMELEGPILSSEKFVRQLNKYKDDKTIDAILLRMDSPGGIVAPSQEIYEAVKKVRDSGKVIVVSMGSVAASGAYYIALGATKIVANPGTITGSIGVIFDFMSFGALLEKIGLKTSVIKSGKFKDSGSPYRDMTPEETQYFQELINDTYNQFVDVVVSERELPLDEVLKLADGRVFTGHQAVQLHLIDTLGTFEDAVAIAADLAGVSKDARRIRERKTKLRLIDILFGDIEEAMPLLLKKSYLAFMMK